MKMRFSIDGREHDVGSCVTGNDLDLVVDGKVYRADVRRDDGHRQTVTIDGRPHRVVVARDGDRFFIHAHGRVWQVQPVDPLALSGADGAHADRIQAPMPGTVVSVAVAPGAIVAEGDPILVIESMKLETTIRAPHRATVDRLPVSTGDSFDKGAVLVGFAPEPGPVDDGARSDSPAGEGD